jgi:hypothetical protein
VRFLFVALTVALHQVLTRQLSDFLAPQQEAERDSFTHDRQLLDKVKANLLDEIDELEKDIKGASIKIAESASDHVHAREVMLTFGYRSALKRCSTLNRHAPHCVRALLAQRSFPSLAPAARY